MSFLKDFSPKRTRKIKSELKEKLPEVHSSPVQEIKREIEPEVTEKLIEQYAYTTEPKKEQDYFRAIARKEQNAPKSDEKYFGFYELTFKCEEQLLNYLYGPKDPKFTKIYNLEKECIWRKLEVIAEYKKEVTFEKFKDYLYYFKGEVIIPEEFINLTGFLREYLKLEKVIVLYKTGEMLLIETEYCNFWLPKRLQKITDGSLRELSHTEIFDENACLDCIYNWNCPFARIQQMTNK